MDHGYQELASILRPVTRRFFIFLSLHHPNNHFENISIFVRPSSTQQKKILEGHITPFHPRLCLWLHKHLTSLGVLDFQARLQHNNVRMLYRSYLQLTIHHTKLKTEHVSTTHKACFHVAQISSLTRVLVILLLTFYEAVGIDQLRAEWSRIRIPRGAFGFFPLQNVQIDSCAHPQT